MIIKDLSKSFHPVPKNSCKNVIKEEKSNQKKIKQKTEKEILKNKKRSGKKKTKTKLKKKSNKLKKLEKERDKNRLKSGKCDFCHKNSLRLDPHEVYGGSNRKRSIEYDFVKNLCRKCHSNPEVVKQLRIDIQKEFEKEHTREEFIKITGKSYL